MPYEETLTLWHGTDLASAQSIVNDGIDIDKCEGGYFGCAFYVTPDKELAWSNYADWVDEDGEPGAVVEFELIDPSRTLDMRDPDDWGVYQARRLDQRISDPDYPHRAVRLGVTGVYDRSNDALAVYDPRILRVVAIHTAEDTRVRENPPRKRVDKQKLWTAFERAWMRVAMHGGDATAKEIAKDYGPGATKEAIARQMNKWAEEGYVRKIETRSQTPRQAKYGQYSKYVEYTFASTTGSFLDADAKRKTPPGIVAEDARENPQPKGAVPTVWYHGDTSRRANFNSQNMDRDRSRDPNAMGPGIYWTSDKKNALGYAPDSGGYVYTATIKVKTARLLRWDTKTDPKKVEWLIEQCDDTDGFLANWGYDPGYMSREKALRDALRGYASPDMYLIDSLLLIYHDCYGRENANEFAARLVEMGFDAFIQKLRSGIYHLAVYNPRIIKVIKEERATTLRRERG